MGRTRVVANPRGYAPGGVPENPAFMPALLLDFGDGDYRIVIPAAPIERQAYPLLAQRFPGADLALLLQDGRRVMLPLGSGRAHVFGEEQTVSFRFAKVKR